MNIIEKLKSFKVEVTPEMEKAFAGDFLSSPIFSHYLRISILRRAVGWAKRFHFAHQYKF